MEWCVWNGMTTWRTRNHVLYIINSKHISCTRDRHSSPSNTDSCTQAIELKCKFVRNEKIFPYTCPVPTVRTQLMRDYAGDTKAIYWILYFVVEVVNRSTTTKWNSFRSCLHRDATWPFRISLSDIFTSLTTRKLWQINEKKTVFALRKAKMIWLSCLLAMPCVKAAQCKVGKQHLLDRSPRRCHTKEQ